MSRFLVYSVALVGVFVCAAIAEVPQLMSYQGRVTDDTGQPASDTVDLIVTIFDDAAATNPLWSETHPDVPVSDGLFDLVLGSVTPIPNSIFGGDARWLGVQVDGGPVSDPLVAIVSTAYAYRAADADTAKYAHASPGTNGWVDDGSVVRLSTSGDLVGVGTASPLCNLHVQGTSIGLTASAMHSDDVTIESTDAALGLYSSDAGSAGSQIAFGEIADGALVDKWALVRETSGNNDGGLRMTFGASRDAWLNSTVARFDQNGDCRRHPIIEHS